MTAPNVTSTRVKGHALAHEGAPHTKDGRIACGSFFIRTAGEGCGKCECGELSPVMPSANARKTWHQRHKQEVRGEG